MKARALFELLVLGGALLGASQCGEGTLPTGGGTGGGGGAPVAQGSTNGTLSDGGEPIESGTGGGGGVQGW